MHLNMTLAAPKKNPYVQPLFKLNTKERLQNVLSFHSNKNTNSKQLEVTCIQVSEFN